MATFSKVFLSESSFGKAIKVSATSSPGTTIHTTETSSSIIDEIWLYAYNSSASSVAVTFQYGGTSTPDDDIKISIPTQSGLTLVVPGLILAGSGVGSSIVRCYASVANVITISGYVNRIQ